MFFVPSVYKKHLKRYHEKNVKFSCMVCKMSFTALKKKWDHMWQVRILQIWSIHDRSRWLNV